MIEFYLYTCSILILFASLIIGLIAYSYNKEGKFNFLNQFPYELKNNKNWVMNLFSRGTLALGCGTLSILSLYMMFFNQFNIVAKSFSLLLVLTNIFLLGLFVLDMSDYKGHIVLISLFYVCNFLSYMMFGFWTLRDPLKCYPLGVTIALFIIGFLILISMFTPLLANWYILKKEEKKEGVFYSRGKVFILSFIEWLNILMFLILYFFLVFGQV